MKKRLRNAWEQLKEAPRRKQVYVALGLLAAILLVVEAALFGGVWFSSVQEGLSIYLSADEDALSTTDGGEIRFSLGTRNAPFCEASCTWQAIDHVTNQTLAEGTHQGRDAEYAVTIAPHESLTMAPLQILAVCENIPRTRCQRDEDTQRAAETVLVKHVLEEDERDARDALEDERAAVIAAHEETLRLLEGIAAVGDARIEDITSRAEESAQQLRERWDASQADVDAHRYTDAYQRLTTQLPTDAISAYQEQVAAERAAAQTLTELSTLRETLSEATRLLNASQRGALEARWSAAWRAANQFSVLLPSAVLGRASQAQDDLEATREEILAIAAPRTDALEEALLAERRMTCTLKNTSCPPQIAGRAENLSATSERAAQACDGIAGLDAEFEAASQALASTYPSLAADADALRAEPGWPVRAETIRDAARQGVLAANLTERLAVELERGEQTQRLTQSYCGAPQALPSWPAREASLPESPRSDATLSIRLPEPQCCVDGVCMACQQNPRPPVLLVHGHSFSERSAPEYNLQALTELGLGLQDHYYYGDLFAGDGGEGLLGLLPEPVAATTTYYLNTYSEEGERILVTQKSEDIETYAVRLSESIQAVRERTGEERVVIVAHSMGGLVAREYLRIFGSRHVAGLVMIGTPNQGITARTDRVCPLIGGDRECEDMRAGSVFLRKLNSAQQPSIPMLTIAGTGCSGRDFDGVVDVESVRLPGVPHITVEGNCSGELLLHSKLTRPEESPEAFAAVQEFLENRP